MISNKIKRSFDQDYNQTLKELIEYELDNGAVLRNQLTIEEVIEQFLASDYSTVFGLSAYFEEV